MELITSSEEATDRRATPTRCTHNIAPSSGQHGNLQREKEAESSTRSLESWNLALAEQEAVMEIFSNRLATFRTDHPSKRRSSGASLDFDAAWPHARPTPEELADAGFYHAPTALSPDNTACFLCQRALDGWEKEDDPLTEHLRLSQGCGWAIMMDIARKSSNSDSIEDPTTSRIKEARRATFRGWPHDGKRGWACKGDKLSLDGWEPKDDPFDEHYRRSKDCPFFQFAVKKPAKGTRTKKARSTKTSNTLSQSTTPATSDATPTETDVAVDENRAPEATSKKVKPTRKNIKAKSKTTRSKKATTPVPEPQFKASAQDTPYQEPEQPFEPPVNYPSKKRPSDAMDDAQELAARQLMASSQTAKASAIRGAKRTKKSTDDRRLMYMARVEIGSHDGTTPPARDAPQRVDGTSLQPQSADEPSNDRYVRTIIDTDETAEKSVRAISSDENTHSPGVDNTELDALLQSDVDLLARNLPRHDPVRTDSPRKTPPSRHLNPKASQHKGSRQEETTRSTFAADVKSRSSETRSRSTWSEDADARRSVSPMTRDTPVRTIEQPNATVRSPMVQTEETVAHDGHENESDNVDVYNNEDEVEVQDEPIKGSYHDEQPAEIDADSGESDDRSNAPSLEPNDDEDYLKDMAGIVPPNSSNNPPQHGDSLEEEEPEPEEEAVGSADNVFERPVEESNVTSSNIIATDSEKRVDEPGETMDESADVENGGERSPPAAPQSPRRPVKKPQPHYQEGSSAQSGREKNKISVLRSEFKVPEQASSDTENRPPSNKTPTTERNPTILPAEPQMLQTVLPTRTPTKAPTSKPAQLHSMRPWTEVDIDEVLLPNSDGDGNDDDMMAIFLNAKGELTEEEKEMTVEEWIKYTAEKAEEKLK
ncbi:hypothetical protein KEM54_006863, partial [Ascosphaera aggregata]